ncbi:MAG: wax ester/triacylglycerol synthase family O-acyltransferase [Acidimicrobiales bacterium]|jgi:WS/DGAT/MGAT family acyltransferase|nr:wax ester/triacylglycerol synthase family O-acyltransferase [Acidimicrobiales bacterium]
MQRLSAMDASFLYMETPTYHMHVCGVLLLDPSTMQGGYSFERIREFVAERLHLVPILRQRVVEVPLSIDYPVWVDDPDFDLDLHLRRLQVRPPGTRHELAELVGDIASRPLDRSLPLWEINVVEGLEDGCVAFVSKMHHATVDGETGTDFMGSLLDLDPAAPGPAPPEEPWTPERVPSDLGLLRDATVSRLRDPLRAVRAIGRTGRSLVGIGRGLSGIGTETRLRPALPFSGPRTKLNAPVTPGRAVAFGQAQLDDLKLVKKTFGTTVNDVVLAASAITLRRWLATYDTVPDRPLVVSVPVSVHGQRASTGINQVSNMFVRLPVDLEDPIAVLARIREETKDAKAVHNAMGVDLIQDMAQIAPPGVYNLAMRLVLDSALTRSLPPVQNAVISNVPGPPIPLYLAGAQVRGMYPFGPLIEGSGINITVLSNMGNMDFGVIACGDTVPDIWAIADGFGLAVRELTDRAHADATAS